MDIDSLLRRAGNISGNVVCLSLSANENPLMSFLLFFLTTLIPLLFNAGWDLWTLTLIHLLTIALVVAIAFENLSNGEFEFSYSAIDVFFLIFLFFCIFSCVFSINRFNTRNEIYNHLNYYLLYFSAFYLFNTTLKKRIFFYLLIGVGLFVSSMALWQWQHGQAIVGTLVNANVFSAYLVVCMLAAITLLCNENNFSHKTIRMCFLFISFIIFAAVLALTRSLGGWLGFFWGSCIFLFIMVKKKFFKLKKIALAGLIVFGVFMAYFVVLKGREPGVFNRVQWWKAAINIAKAHPISGVGLGNFGGMYLRYKTAGLNSVYAHNYLLQIMSETGVPGFFSLLILLFSIGFWYVKRLRSLADENQFLVAGGFSIFSALLLNSLIDFGLNFPAIAIVFWVLIGVVSSGFKRKTVTIFWNNSKMILCAFLCLIAAMVVIKPFVASQKYVQGQDELAANNLAMAEEHFLWSARLDSLNSETYASLSDVYARKNRKDVAIAYLKKAISLNPYYGPFQHNLSLIYAEAGDLEAALSAAGKARDNHPLKPLYHYTLSILYGKAGRAKDADYEFKRYKELSQTLGLSANTGDN